MENPFKYGNIFSERTPPEDGVQISASKYIKYLPYQVQSRIKDIGTIGIYYSISPTRLKDAAHKVLSVLSGNVYDQGLKIYLDDSTKIDKYEYIENNNLPAYLPCDEKPYYIYTANCMYNLDMCLISILSHEELDGSIILISAPTGTVIKFEIFIKNLAQSIKEMMI